jgi:hypothetical protein
MVLDFMGREIRPGNTVCYPVRRGSSMWLNELRVQQAEPGKVSGFNTEGRRVTISNLKNVVVVGTRETAQATAA